jgi:hypothetical protein
MSRANSSRPPAGGFPDQSAGLPAINDSASVAEEIGLAVLELAKRAQGVGLTMIGYLLESVALEAGAQAAARQAPADAAEGWAAFQFRDGSAGGGPYAPQRRPRLTTPRPRSPRSRTPRARGGQS